MMKVETKKFSIDLNANDGALLRVIGLIERRGHRVISMHSYMPTPVTFKLELEIEKGTPRQDVLIHQIKRLADVVEARDMTAEELQAGMQKNVLRYSRHDMMHA
jgi:acetolactate synthase regulatory subunit